MPNILDVYGDKSLRGLVSMLRENPEYYDVLKDVEVDYDEQQTLPASSFAYPEERAYPIHDDRMALLSSMYKDFFPPEDLPESVNENFKKAEYMYDLKLPKKKDLKTVVKKAAIKEEDYLIPSLKKFPVRNQKEADFVQKILVKNAQAMGYDHLAEACNNLIEKYASFGAESEDVNPIVYKYAGLTLSKRDFLDASINRRKDFVDTKFHESYDKLAKIVDEMDFNRNNLLKVASALEEMDTESQVRHLYDKYIPNPMDSVFNTNKIYKSVKTASEELFTHNHAEIVTEDHIKNLLGEDILKEASVDGKLDKPTLVDVMNSLPRDLVTDFVERLG